MDEVAGVVACAPEGNGGEIRGIGFEEDSVERRLRRHLHGFAGVLIGQRPVEAHIPAPFPQLPGQLHAAGIAVEHAPEAGELTDEGEAVSMGVPVVNDHRQVQLRRQRQVTAQHLLLVLLRGILRPVVVQPDLPDGDGLRMLCQLPQGIDVPGDKGRAVLRMPAHRGVNVGISLRQRHRGTGGIHIAAGVDNQSHPVFRHGGEQLAAVRVELLVVIMGMCIKNECHKSLAEFRARGRERSSIEKTDDMRVSFFSLRVAPVRLRRAGSAANPSQKSACTFLKRQHIFAPAGMASSSIMRFSFSAPFSLWTAEISMPQLSRPIIFRGGRLMIASSVLPTSCSGS